MLKSAAAALSRNGTRINPNLLCHFMTHNQKLRCSPETSRLRVYGIQGIPKKIWAFDIPVLQCSRGKILVSTIDNQNLGSNWAQIFLRHLGYHKRLTWKFQDCTATLILCHKMTKENWVYSSTIPAQSGNSWFERVVRKYKTISK